MKTNWLKQKGMSVLILAQSARATQAFGSLPAQWLPYALMPLGSIVVPGFYLRNNNTIGFADLVSRFGA